MTQRDVVLIQGTVIQTNAKVMVAGDSKNRFRETWVENLQLPLASLAQFFLNSHARGHTPEQIRY